MCDWILENWPKCHTRPTPFIGAANGYIHTLPIHSSITRLCWLLCFYRVGYADHVKSQQVHWVPWRVLNRRHRYEIYQSGSENLRSSGHVRADGWYFLDSWLLQTILTESTMCCQLPIIPHYPPQPLLAAHPLAHATCDITVSVKKLFKLQQLYIAC